MESRHDPREALLKIPPPGSRAPADGGFPPLRETQRRGAGGARAGGLEVKQQTGGLLHLPRFVISLSDKKDGKGGHWGKQHTAAGRAEAGS